jgi:hypothetical protein
MTNYIYELELLRSEFTKMLMVKIFTMQKLVTSRKSHNMKMSK